MLGKTLLIVVLGVLVLAGYTGYQVLQVKDGLETVAGEVEPAVQELEAGDASAVRLRLDTVQEGAAKAADNSKGPGWWLASKAPRYGDDVEAVRTVADVSDVLASGVLPKVVRATTRVENIDPYDGPEALDELESAGKSLARAKKQLQRQERRVAAIEVDELDPRLAAPIEQVQLALGTASGFLDGKLGQAEQALAAVPSLP